MFRFTELCCVAVSLGHHSDQFRPIDGVGSSHAARGTRYPKSAA